MRIKIPHNNQKVMFGNRRGFTTFDINKNVSLKTNHSKHYTQQTIFWQYPDFLANNIWKKSSNMWLIWQEINMEIYDMKITRKYPI